MQFLYMKRIMENMAFDQIYHEHLLYYNLKTLEVLLNRHCLSVFDAYIAPIHGGSVIAYATHQGRREPSARLQEMLRAEEEQKCNEHQTYLDFAERIKRMKTENLAYLGGARATMLVTRVPDISRYGSVEFGADRAVTAFREKAESRGAGHINAGVYMLGESVIAEIPRRCCSLEREIFPALIGKGLFAFPSQGLFIDIGVPDDYARAQSLFGQDGL